MNKLEWNGKIRKLRLDYGLSQEKLGEKIGESRFTISSYESGRRKPDMDKMNLLCKALNTNMDYIFGNPQFEDTADNIKEYAEIFFNDPKVSTYYKDKVMKEIISIYFKNKGV